MYSNEIGRCVYLMRTHDKRFHGRMLNFIEPVLIVFKRDEGDYILRLDDTFKTFELAFSNDFIIKEGFLEFFQISQLLSNKWSLTLGKS